MNDNPGIQDDRFERFLEAQRAVSRQSALRRAEATQRFQFTLGRSLASIVPLAMALLFLHYALRFPAMAMIAIATTTTCLGWAGAILFRNMESVLIVPVCLVVLFVLLFVGA
jgi:hypothetical protein